MLELPAVASVTKPIILAVLVLAAFMVVYPAARDRLSLLTLTDNQTGSQAGQSAAQISPSEFEQIETGVSLGGLRGLLGEPASKGSTEVEGLRLECWYYGIAGATGAYQLCFENDRLATKLRFLRDQ